MYMIICTIVNIRHEYAGEGAWVQTDGLRFATEAEARARLDADLWRINPRIRHSVTIEEDAPADANQPGSE